MQAGSFRRMRELGSGKQRGQAVIAARPRSPGSKNEGQAGAAVLAALLPGRQQECQGQRATPSTPQTAFVVDLPKSDVGLSLAP